MPQRETTPPHTTSEIDSLRALYDAELRRTQELQAQLARSTDAAESLERFAIEADASLREARAHVGKLRALHCVALRMSSDREPPALWDDALDLLGSLAPSSGLAVYSTDGPSPHARVALLGVPLRVLPPSPAQAPSVLRWALRADNPGSLTSDDARYLAVPICSEATAVGAFALARTSQDPPFTATETELCEMVAQIVSRALDGAARYRAMEDQALSDALTGVANYRYFRKQIELEVARAQRFRYPLGLLIADLDHFKAINDQHGHPAGDKALARAAQAMLQAIRRSDVLARVGGEEFAVILPACDPQQARLVGDKLRQAVRMAHGVGEPGGAVISLTVSVGGASLADHALRADTLIERADAALLQAKRAGRNRTVLWGELDSPESD